MKNISMSLCAVVLLLFTVACPSSDTAYGKANQVGLSITDVLHTGADTADRLRVAGTISKDEEKSALQYMQALNDLDTVYRNCVESMHAAAATPTGYVDCANAFMSGANDGNLLSDLKISNEESKKEFLLIGNTAVALLRVAINELTSPPPAKP